MPTSATSDPPPTHENQGRHFRQRTIGITPFEQAQRSWARPIASYKELPAEFREWFEPEHAGAPFPLAVLTPSFEGFLHHEIERLVCATSEAVTILERRGRRVEVRRYPIDEISLVEVSSVLLDARLRIEGREGGSDRVSSTSLRFNAVTEFLFTPIVETIRSAGVPRRVRPEAEPGRFAEWGRRSFKFMNYARRSLLGEERVVCALLQPEIRRPVVSAFGRTLHHIAAPTHATLLTERELIDVRETVSPGNRDRYGGVWTFIPLRQVERMSLGRSAHEIATLLVDLPGGHRLELPFEMSAGDELERLLTAYSALRRSSDQAAPSA